jgi:hypothetical protein
MTPAEMRVWVAESRARQGLGPTITDPAAQQQVAAMAADALTRENSDGTEHDDGGPSAVARRRYPTPTTTASKQRERADEAS